MGRGGGGWRVGEGSLINFLPLITEGGGGLVRWRGLI